MRRVVVVGSFNVDHVWRCETLPEPGQTLSGAYSSGPGGKGFNQAIAARRAGAHTRLVCALGQDAGAALASSLAEAERLELQAKTVDAPTGTAGIYVDAQGRNSIVIGAGANAMLNAGFVASPAAGVAEAAVVLVQLESPADAVRAALQSARAAHVLTILNPAPANARPDAALLALADVLTPNETEFVALLAEHVGQAPEANAVARLGRDQLHALCRRLQPHGSVVVTLGEAGCFVSHPEHARRGDADACYRIAATPVDAVDTTGAGDAFNGALAARLATASDADFATQVRFASRYAALSTEHAGAALSMPTLDALQQRFPA